MVTDAEVNVSVVEFTAPASPWASSEARGVNSFTRVRISVSAGPGQWKAESRAWAALTSDASCSSCARVGSAGALSKALVSGVTMPRYSEPLPAAEACAGTVVVVAGRGFGAEPVVDGPVEGGRVAAAPGTAVVVLGLPAVVVGDAEL
jgi:hypothetical protein